MSLTNVHLVFCYDYTHFNGGVFCFSYFRLRTSDGRDPKYGKAPLFGVYVTPLRDNAGIISIGDSVMVEKH